MLSQQILNAIVLGSIYALFSIGLSLAWGTLDVLNLAHGSIFVFGGFLAYELSKLDGLPFVVMLLGGAVGAGIVAVCLELVAFRHIRGHFTNKRQAELSMLVASVGAGLVIDQVIANETNNQVFSVEGAFSIHTYHIGSLSISNIQILIIVVAVLIGLALDLWVSRSRQGRAVRGIAFDPAICGLLGVNVGRLAIMTMAVSGALAGLAGVLLGVETSGQDVTVGHSYLLKGFAVIIVGGVGSIRGGMIAAYMLAAGETAMIAYGPGGFADAVAFALIVLVLLVRPQGLLGRVRAQRA